MVLKRIEAFGFKSFADRVSIDFSSGVTAIVGPNGCGKSNVSDSIRWVLGEQSAKSLRGEKMEDVIFSGTVTRPPLGVAEVIITFDNTHKIFPLEFTEVSIGRRLFRDGQSSYLLNGQDCRLRDIHDLMMDSGIGRRTHSIIEQGKIDEIVTARPEQRRQIIEEAAGISKYRSRRAEALRKLESTRDGLRRVDDLIAELERQEGSLRRQSRKAERFREAEAELRTLEIAHSRRKIDEIARSVVSLREDRVRQEDALAGAEVEIGELNLEITRGEEKLSEEQENLRARGRELSEAEKASSAAEAQMIELKKRHTDDGRTIDQMTAELERLHDRRAQDEAQERILIAELDALAADIEILSRDLTSSREAGKVRSDDLLSVRGQERDIRVRREGLEKALALLHSDIEHAESAIVRASEAHAAFQVQKDALLEERTKLNEEQILLSTQADNVEREWGLLKAQKEEAIARYKAITTEIEDVTRDTDRSESQCELLRERFHQASARAQSERDELEIAAREIGVPLSALGECIFFEADHAAAFSAALAESHSGILIESSTSREAVEKNLTDRWPGKTILTSRAGSPCRQAWQPSAEMTPLRDLLKPESPAVMNTFLAGWYFAESSADALSLLERLDDRERVVTRDGEVFWPFGAMRRVLPGETDHLASGRAVLRGAIEQYESKIALLKERASVLHSDRADLSRDIEIMDEALDGVEELKNEVRQTIYEIGERLANDRLSEVEAAMAESDRELGQARASVELLRRDEELRAGEHEAVMTELSASERAIAIQEAEIDKLRREVSELERRESLLVERNSGKESERERLVVRMVETTASIERYAAMIDENIERRRNLEIQIGSLNERFAALTVELEERRQAFRALESLVNDLAGTLGRMRADHRNVTNRRDAARELIHEMALRESGLQGDVRVIKERISDRYGIDLDAVEPVEAGEPVQAGEPVEAGEPIEAATTLVDGEQRLAELRETIERMGAVNFAAAEELGEVEQRALYYRTQRADLAKADEDLAAVISEIDGKTISLFHETFKAVNANFGLLFNRLFVTQGTQKGSAELVLLDPDNPLESGIDIVAMPPGKKPQSISLLSGGEKAMTAIALLFAVFLVRPSPFAILDELDAPLDEANVERYARILKEFAQRSQFVVVTHNKRTMEIADTLYGVAMPERGVTSVFGVKLSEAEEMGQAAIS